MFKLHKQLTLFCNQDIQYFILKTPSFCPSRRQIQFVISSLEFAQHLLQARRERQSLALREQSPLRERFLN